ncbi:YcaO-like family protein [Streptomyces globosus]
MPRCTTSSRICAFLPHRTADSSTFPLRRTSSVPGWRAATAPGPAPNCSPECPPTTPRSSTSSGTTAACARPGPPATPTGPPVSPAPPCSSPALPSSPPPSPTPSPPPDTGTSGRPPKTCPGSAPPKPPISPTPCSSPPSPTPRTPNSADWTSCAGASACAGCRCATNAAGPSSAPPSPRASQPTSPTYWSAGSARPRTRGSPRRCGRRRHPGPAGSAAATSAGPPPNSPRAWSAGSAARPPSTRPNSIRTASPASNAPSCPSPPGRGPWSAATPTTTCSSTTRSAWSPESRSWLRSPACPRSCGCAPWTSPTCGASRTGPTTGRRSGRPGPISTPPAAAPSAVERYCGSRLPEDRLRHGSHDSLRRAGIPALDPRRLHLYSERQYRSDGFPFAPLTTDAECSWVEGRSWTTGEPVWVPAFLVAHGEHDPLPYSDPLVAGVACGVSEEHAVTSGLEEVIERDTTMLWWANAARLPRLPMTDRLRALTADSADAYDTTLIPLDNEFGVPVLAAVVRDRATGWLAIGFATRPDPHEAAEKALAEGFTLHHTCRFLDDEKALGDGVADLPHLGNLKPYRADRRYLDSYRPDFADVRDLLCQQQLHLDPRAGGHVAPWLDDLPFRPWHGLPALGERRLAAYRERVEARGFEVISVDLTTCDAEAAGFSAAHTIVPGLVSNFPAGMPMWGNGRIGRAGVRLGWRPQPLAENEYNVFPLPHA